MNTPVERLRDWVPARVLGSAGDPMIEWCYMGEARFTDPFFDDTLHRQMRLPFNMLFRRQTPLDVLADLKENDAEIIPPTGFIYHLSRCGSTLVAQMLASLEKNIVISEAPPIDAIISSSKNIPSATRQSWIKSIVNAFGRRRTNAERHYFVKFDAWNTLDLPLISNVFPDVPFIFIYRDPIEVIVSQLREPGSQMVPGAMRKLLPELTLEEALRTSREEYCARILGAICSAALEFANDPRALFVNYDRLPGAMFEEIAEHFQIGFDSNELELMKMKTRYHAKSPNFSFTPDGERKRREATESVRGAAALWVDPSYERLKELSANDNQSETAV